MKNNYEIEIQKTLESLDSVEGAHPKPFLFGRIQNRLKKEKEVSFFREWQYQIAAGFIIILLNAAVIYTSFQQTDAAPDEVDYLVEEYGFSTSNYDLTEE